MNDPGKPPDPETRTAQIPPDAPPKQPNFRRIPQRRGSGEKKGVSIEDEERSVGPNLFVAYSLIAFALLAAIALAALIVWPFYKSR